LMLPIIAQHAAKSGSSDDRLRFGDVSKARYSCRRLAVFESVSPVRRAVAEPESVCEIRKALTHATPAIISRTRREGPTLTVDNQQISEVVYINRSKPLSIRRDVKLNGGGGC
jgi:hypothetical protein